MTMRTLIFNLLVAVAWLGGSSPPAAQDMANGQRLAERWCTECHAIGSGAAKYNRATPFLAIAAKDAMTAKLIASFLLMPHATMANPPLRRQDAEDIAAYIMSLKN